MNAEAEVNAHKIPYSFEKYEYLISKSAYFASVNQKTREPDQFTFLAMVRNNERQGKSKG